MLKTKTLVEQRTKQERIQMPPTLTWWEIALNNNRQFLGLAHQCRERHLQSVRDDEVRQPPEDTVVSPVASQSGLQEVFETLRQRQGCRPDGGPCRRFGYHSGSRDGGGGGGRLLRQRGGTARRRSGWTAAEERGGCGTTTAPTTIRSIGRGTTGTAGWGPTTQRRRAIRRCSAILEGRRSRG